MSKALRPLFVTVTWGAGGSTAARSLELAEICQRQLGMTTCLHLTCTNMSRKIVDETLAEAKAIGVCNILALRGDPSQRECDIQHHNENGNGSGEFVWAVDLVRYIRHKHGNFFCIGVAAYPEGHADESHPAKQEVDQDIPYLVEKVKAGADFIMTQLFYSATVYIQYEKKLRVHESGVFKDIPIIPGLMPIQSYQIVKRTVKLSHASFPQELVQRLESVKADDEAVKEVGVEALTDIINDIKGVQSSGPRGFHFYTLNLEKAVGWILEKSRLISSVDSDNVTIENAERQRKNAQNANGYDGIAFQEPEIHSCGCRSSIVSNQAQLSISLTSPQSASPSSRVKSLAATHGLTPAGREATWDDYPNGRFGDARSPAFNLPLSYSPYFLNVSPQQARKMWGQPTARSMVSDLFVRHLNGAEPSQLPWSDTATLSEETKVISDKLLSLIQGRGWWTIASQPAVDGLPSSDSVHGWGPAGGFVFQKPFVELFIPAEVWDNKLGPCLKRAELKFDISWYAENFHGDFESSESEDSVHAVTWGSFKGKEIATATMVEQINFRQWVEEAFSKWEQWSRAVIQEQSRVFLQSQKNDLWLINIIGHGYRQGEGNKLWDILMNA